MTPKRLFRLAGGSAYLSAVLFLSPVISGVVLAVLREPPSLAGSMTFPLSGFSPLFLVPVALALHSLYRGKARNISLAATTIGIGSMLASTGLHALRVLEAVRMEVALPLRLVADPAVAIWLLVVGYLVLSRGKLPRGLGWLAIVTSASMLLHALNTSVFLFRGAASGVDPIPSFPTLLGHMGNAGSLASMLAYPVWAIWLGLRLRSEIYW